MNFETNNYIKYVILIKKLHINVIKKKFHKIGKNYIKRYC